MSGRTSKLLRRYAASYRLWLPELKRWWNELPRPLRRYARGQMIEELHARGVRA